MSAPQILTLEWLITRIFTYFDRYGRGNRLVAIYAIRFVSIDEPHCPDVDRDRRNGVHFNPWIRLTVAIVDFLAVTAFFPMDHDQIGSTRLLTNAAGEASGADSYQPYGSLETSTGSATSPLGFAGQFTAGLAATVGNLLQSESSECFDFGSAEINSLIATVAAAIPGAGVEAGTARAGNSVGLSPLGERILHIATDVPGLLLEAAHVAAGH